MASRDTMTRRPSLPWGIPLVVTACLLFSSCASVPKLWDAPVIQKEVEYITQRLECGPEPQVDSLRLAEYEPIVIPSLLDLGAPVDNIPEYLAEHLDHTWWALSPEDWQDIDENDIDKKRFTAQLQAVIEFYRKCLAGQKPILNDSAVQLE